MSDDRQQVKVEHRRRSRRNGQEEVQVSADNGQDFQETQVRLGEIDSIIKDMVTTPNAQPSVVLGGDQPHDVRAISSEELVNNFRQQSGQ